MSNIKHQNQSEILTVEKTRVKPPPLYNVLLHNDDYTPMDFVVMILESIFHKSHEDAITIMLKVHRQGVGLCGSYPYEVAESKTRKVNAISRENQYPLKCTMEPE